MERGNVMVVAVVTAALALFILARFSRSSSDSFAHLDGAARYGAGAEGTGASGLDSGYAGDATRPEKRGAGALGGFADGKAGGAREALRLADRGSAVRRGSAGIVSVPGNEKRHGTLGFSGSRSHSTAGASGVTITETGEPSGPDAPGSSRMERRSDLVDFLAEKPTGTNSLLEDPEKKPDEENTDVVLSAPLDREAGTVANDDTPPLVENDLQFAEDGVGVKFEDGSVLAFPDAGNVRGDAGSLTMEFQPEWSGAEKGDYSLVNVRTPNDPSNSLRLFKNGRYLRFLFSDNTGRERNIGYDMINWQPGEQHTVTATWEQGVTSLYVDNQLVGTNYYEGQLEVRPGTPMYVGSDVPEAPPSGANATISNFRVYGRALSSDEVASYQFPTDAKN